MKLKFHYVTFFALIILLSCKEKKDLKILTDRIEYAAIIKSPDIEMDWWIQNIEGPDRDRFVKGIFNMIRKGELKIYDEESALLKDEELDARMHYIDTFRVVLNDENEKIKIDSLITRKLKVSDINEIVFREKWFISYSPFSLEKEVLGFGLSSNLLNQYSIENKSDQPVFWVLMDSVNKLERKVETEITEKIQYDVFIKNQDRDGSWWQSNIVKSNRIEFSASLIKAAQEDVFEIHDFYTNNQLSGEEVRNILSRIDTITIQDPNPPNNWKDTTIVNNIEAHDIVKIRFLESWSIDWGNMSFSKKINAIAPIVESYSENGDFRGYRPLFWIYFSN